MVAIPKSKEFMLRHFRMSDSKAYFECLNDGATKHGFMDTTKNLGEAKKKIRKMIAEYNKAEPHDEYLAIEVGGEFAGYVCVDDLNKEHFKHRGGIGYCIHPKYRGNGLATKATLLITNYAFKKYRLKRMVGMCRTFNKASARVLEKAGYKLEGILRKNKCKNGKYLDDMMWAKVR